MATNWKQFQIGDLIRSRFGRSLGLILLLFTLVPVLIILIVGTIAIRDQLLNHSIDQLKTNADLIQEAVSQWTVDANNQLAQTLANPVVAQNSLFALRTGADTSRSEGVLIQNFQPLIDAGYFTHVSIVNLDGVIAVSTNPGWKGQDFEVDFANEPNLYWGITEIALADSHLGLTWRPVLEPSGEQVGFLVGSFSFATLTQILDNNTATLGKGGQAYLLDQHGHLITLQNIAPSFDKKITENLNNSTDTSGLMENHGVDVVANVQPLKASVEAWLVVEQPQSEAFSLLINALPVAVGFAVVLAAVAFAAAVLTSSRITSVLRSLESSAQKVAAGELKARVETTRQDEFGSLATSFNTMATELDEAFTRLAGSNRELTNRAEQMATITKVGQLAIEFLDLDKLLNTVVHEIQRAFHYYAVVVYLPDNKNPTLVEARSVAGAANTGLLKTGLQWPMDESNSVGSAAKNRRVVYIKDFTKETSLKAYKVNPGTRSEVNIPLLAANSLIGVLNLQSDKPNAFNPIDVEVLQILGNLIAIAIHNAELFEDSEHARQLADDANRQKSDFLSNMSHELRTPLNVIIGYSHSVLNRPEMYGSVELPEVYQEVIRTIMEAGQHLLGLITDILDLSKIEAGRMDLELAPIDPTPILQGIRATALGIVKEGVKVRANYPNDLPPIMGDELRVRQILLNLVSNAAKFTEQGFITIDAKRQGEIILFSVADTGMGIPEDMRSLIFTRFQQARNTTKKYRGTGLGLSISRELTRMHGGDIWFETEINKGTTFYFTMPIASIEKDRTSTQPRRPESTIPLSTRVTLFAEREEVELIKQVMLVDFHSTTRTRLHSALTEVGYDVLVVDDPELAATLATALLPDVMLLHKHGSDDTAILDVITKLKAETTLAPIPMVVIEDAENNGDMWWIPVMEQIQHALDPLSKEA